jgi:AcrR family transcriptional regulator
MAQMMDCPDSPKRGQGRPRSDATRCAILKAAYELLEETGMSGFTIEGVAARSGSAKTTIYRWWPSRGVLAADALLSRIQSNDPDVASGSAIADIQLVMQNMADLLSGATGRVLAGLIAEAQCCSDTSEAIMTNVILRRREKGRDLMERGIAAGEIKPDIDIDAALDALFGPFFSRLMLGRMPFEKGYVGRLAETVLGGIAAHPAASPKKARALGAR